MTDMRRIAREVADDLAGTCGSVTEAIERLDLDVGLADNTAFCRFLDDEVFECSVCGWWSDNSEMGSSTDGGHSFACLECEDG